MLTGVYLPLLWEPNFCNKSPLALGYTRGHFSALVPMEPEATTSMNAHIKSDSELYVSFLPLMDHNHLLLPVHFISQKEVGIRIFFEYREKGKRIINELVLFLDGPGREAIKAVVRCMRNRLRTVDSSAEIATKASVGCSDGRRVAELLSQISVS